MKMEAIAYSSLAFSTVPASDFLRSSSNGGINGRSLKALGKARLGTRIGKGMTVYASIIKKGKKHDYPWPDDADPNVKGGVLFHLSNFKPLKEKPKPVTLDFERPLLDLKKRIVDVRKMADETGLDFSDQILSLETKYQQALRDLYTHLTPIQRVNIARHPNRPTFLDHVFNITEKFVELHGDRAGYDDPAIVTGIGTIDGRRYMFMGHQKGRNTKENIMRNFGMPTPHGYRKALRMMYYADHHGFPIVTFIDTPGAYADLKSEELGQGEAIAHNLRTMFGLKVPIVSIVMGEGGSGGALAIGCANKLLMLENSVFYVASPEACAAILWKSAKASPKAAEKLKITAGELCKLHVADGIIPEPLGGAHADPLWTSLKIKAAIKEAMAELGKMETEELLRHRMLKFRKIGGFQEGITIDPKKKANMKKKEEPISTRTPDDELETEIEKLKQEIVKAKDSSAKKTEPALNEMIVKLEREVDLEYSEAVKSLGFEEKLVKLREDFTKEKNSKDQFLVKSLQDKINGLQEELNQRLPNAPNYSSLKYKADMLDEISKAKSESEKKEKTAKHKQVINSRLQEVIKEKSLSHMIENLKSEIAKSGVSNLGDLDGELKEKMVKIKKELEAKVASSLKSLNLDVEIVDANGKNMDEQPAFSYVKHRVDELNEEINEKIEDIISSSNLKNDIELLKLEIVKAGKSPEPESKRKIESLQQQIKQQLGEAIESSELKRKHDQLKEMISEVLLATETRGSLNGGILQV